MSTINTPNATIVTDEPLTTTITKNNAPGLLRNDIDERIVKIRPMATPLDQISRCAGAKLCNSLVVSYYSVDNRPIETATSQPVEPTVGLNREEPPSFELPVENARIFSNSDTLLLPDVKVTIGKAEQAFIGYVVAKADDNTLIVTPLNAKHDGSAFNFAPIPKGSKVIRMARAAAELDVQSPQFAALPKKESNNCQIFKMQIEQATYQKLAGKEVDWSFSDQEEAAVIDMRLGMEKNFLFGHKCSVLFPEKSEDIYFTGGIWNQTSHDFTYSKDDKLDNDWLVRLTRNAFTGTAAGSPRKILIAGSGLIEKIAGIETSRAIDATQTLVRYGIEFREIRTNFGSLFCVASEIFDQCGRDYDGIIIDPEYLTKYVHVPFRADTLDLRSSGQRNTDAVVLTEASCMVLRHPEAHTRIICKG